MEAEIVLNLLDSYWYDLDLFQKSKPTKINQIPEKPTSYNSDKTIPNLPTIHTNSPNLERMSSNHSKLSDSSYSSASPNSVLLSPRLQTIFSGKEIRDFDTDSKSEEKSAQKVQEISAAGATKLVNNNNSDSSPSSYSADAGGLKGNIVSSRRRKKRLSKSLSDLEFEELKGFMDLGFVFSEEDKDSTLASILPGLQRLGNNTTNPTTTNNNNDDNNNNNNDDTNSNNSVINVIVVDKNASKSTGVSRPYLSEAWELLEKKKKKETSSSVLNWKVPASSDQIDMKGYLKSWAHTVASTVK